MIIDGDLMDGEYLRGENDDEHCFIVKAYSEGLLLNDIMDAFILGIQWERNQQKDDGK